MKGTPLSSVLLDLLGDHEQRSGDVDGGSRAAVLIRDDAQCRPFSSEPQHGLHEVCSKGAIDPGGAQDDVTRQRRADGTLTGLLAAAVDIDGADRVFFAIRFALSPVEDVIGRQVNQRGRRFSAGCGDV